MPEARVLIAAAGAGSRAGLPYPKTLHAFRGQPILVRLIERLRHVDPRPVLVVSPGGQAAIDACLIEYGLEADCVVQESPTGMGDAILCFRRLLGHEAAEHLLVVWGDLAGLERSTVDAVREAHFGHGNDFTFATRFVEEAYTVVERGPDNSVRGVIETREQGAVPAPGERDIGLFLFRTGPTLDLLAQQLPGARGRKTGEHGFLYVIRHLAERGLRVEAVPAATASDLVSLNALSDLDGDAGSNE